MKPCAFHQHFISHVIYSTQANSMKGGAKNLLTWKFSNNYSPRRSEVFCLPCCLCVNFSISSSLHFPTLPLPRVIIKCGLNPFQATTTLLTSRDQE